MKVLKVMLVLTLVLISLNSFAQNTSAKIENLPLDKKTNCYLRYHYFPNIQVYFDLLKMVYYYKEEGQWKTAPELPKNYGGYSLYNKAKVTITDYDGDNPIDLLPIHKKMYPYNSKGRFANTTAGAE
ncbi:hypothetical protein WMW71_06385 [Flavobacterium buctense]|uniref:Uncharacterized protein n=1 Tax=Flavobacterium buctense TaxID=1648146 RepID=A0ABU9DZZ5_9FLAO|nr:hypothetical protein [Flavobacterium buctense]